jgi:uncharacterized protein
VADCGACNFCCKFLDVKSISKPAHMLCWHTTLHGGCAVHAQKSTDPSLTVCDGFKCVWLESQSLEDEARRGTRDMRPDQCHVMFVRDPTDPKLLWVHVDPAHSRVWRLSPVADYLEETIAKGARLEIIVGDNQFSWPETGDARTAS